MEELNSAKFDVPITDLNLADIVSIDSETLLEEVVAKLQADKMGSVTISSGNKLVGIITERDFLLRVVGKIDDWRKVPVKEVMTENPYTLTTETLISECIKKISKYEYRHLPVVDSNGTPKYMLSINDVLKFIVNFFPTQVYSLGTKTDWDPMDIDMFGENFSFDADEGEALSGNIFLSPLHKVITKQPLIMDVGSTCKEVIAAMQEKKRGACLLTKFGTELMGIMTERDFLFKVFGKYDLSKETVPVADFMTPSPHTLLSKHFFAFAINNMFSFKYRNIVIVDEDRYPLATVSLLDIFKYISDYLVLTEVEE